MADYVVTDEQLSSIADAIREMTGDSDLLEFPDGFESAIRNIVGAVTSVNGQTGAVVLTQDDVGNGTTYVRTHNDLTDALKALINGALQKSGGTMSGALSMGSNKITGLAAGTNDGDAVNFSQMSSAISQSAAYYRGSFATRAALLAVAWQTTNPAGANYVTNNDYAVVLDDETQNDECWRYLYVSGTGWTAQYRINETPFTQAQLDALNSGATSTNIGQIATNTAAIANKADKVTEVTISTSGAVSQALDAGKIYHFTGAVSSLSLTLNAAASGQIAQYHFDFESGSTAATVTITGVSWAGGSFVPEASKRYEVDILNGYAVVMAW